MLSSCPRQLSRNRNTTAEFRQLSVGRAMGESLATRVSAGWTETAPDGLRLDVVPPEDARDDLALRPPAETRDGDHEITRQVADAADHGPLKRRQRELRAPVQDAWARLRREGQRPGAVVALSADHHLLFPRQPCASEQAARHRIEAARELVAQTDAPVARRWFVRAACVEQRQVR